MCPAGLLWEALGAEFKAIDVVGARVVLRAAARRASCSEGRQSVLAAARDVIAAVRVSFAGDGPCTSRAPKVLCLHVFTSPRSVAAGAAADESRRGPGIVVVVPAGGRPACGR